jgi:hypothetical protein
MKLSTFFYILYFIRRLTEWHNVEIQLKSVWLLLHIRASVFWNENKMMLYCLIEMYKYFQFNVDSLLSLVIFSANWLSLFLFNYLS